MEQLINIELLKENNQIILSNLPIQAKNELLNFYQYLFFKYNIKYSENNNKINTPVGLTHKEITEKNKLNKEEFLLFLKQGFSVTEEEIQQIEQTQKEINQWKIQEF